MKRFFEAYFLPIVAGVVFSGVCSAATFKNKALICFVYPEAGPPFVAGRIEAECESSASGLNANPPAEVDSIFYRCRVVKATSGLIVKQLNMLTALPHPQSGYNLEFKSGKIFSGVPMTTYCAQNASRFELAGQVVPNQSDSILDCELWQPPDQAAP